jgi:hypothetical protein
MLNDISHEKAPTPPRASDRLQSTSTTQPPPYPERMNLDKPPTQPEFDFLGELKNVCVRIPLFQAIKYVPIYSKCN